MHLLSTLRTSCYRDARKTCSWPVCSTLARPDFHRQADTSFPNAHRIGLFQRLEHLFDALDAELNAAQDGLAREETNLASYSDQLARPFEHEEALLFAQRDLARIDRKLTDHRGSSGPPGPPRINSGLDGEAAA